jgi:hypothetical protein
MLYIPMIITKIILFYVGTYIIILCIVKKFFNLGSMYLHNNTRYAIQTSISRTTFE